MTRLLLVACLACVAGTASATEAAASGQVPQPPPSPAPGGPPAPAGPVQPAAVEQAAASGQEPQHPPAPASPAPPSATGQPPAGSEQATPAQPADTAGPKTAEPAEDAIEPAFNVEVGSPLKLSANLGIRLPLGASGYGRGLLLQVQPGLGGVALNVGYVPVSFGGDGMQLISVGAKAKLLRTWGSPWGTEPGRTYAGFEAGFAVGFKLAVGVLWKLDSGEGDDTVFTWTVGFGM